MRNILTLSRNKGAIYGPSGIVPIDSSKDPFQAQSIEQSSPNQAVYKKTFESSNDYCFFFDFDTTAACNMDVLAPALEIRFRCRSDWAFPPSWASASLSQSGITIARINSCTVISLSSAIFRSFMYA